MGLKALLVRKGLNYGWVVIGTLMIIDAMVMGATFTLGIMMPVIGKDLGMDLRQVGWLGAMNWEVTAILTIPLAFRFARFSPKKTVIASCACQAAFLVAHGASSNYWFLLASRIGFMAAGLIRFPANPMLVQQWFPKNRFTLVNTVSTVFSGIAGGMVVFFMGDLLRALNGWRNIFFAFGALQTVLLLAWVWLGRENRAQEPHKRAETPQGVGIILGNRMLWLLGIGVTGDMIAFGAMETLWPKFATSTGFLTLDKAAYCEGLSYFGFTVGSLLGGMLSMRMGRRKPPIWISGLLLPFVTVGIVLSRSFTATAIFWAFWGISELYFPIISTIPYELPGIRPEQVPVAQAFVVSVFTAGAGLGPIAGSYLAGVFGSLQTALLVICCLPLLLFIAGLLIKETGPAAR